MARRQAFDEQYRAVVECTYLGPPKYSNYTGHIIMDTGDFRRSILGPYSKKSVAKGVATQETRWKKNENIAAAKVGLPEPWDIKITIQKATLQWVDT